MTGWINGNEVGILANKANIIKNAKDIKILQG
jgi:hypothetical protein